MLNNLTPFTCCSAGITIELEGMGHGNHGAPYYSSLLRPDGKRANTMWALLESFDEPSEKGKIEGLISKAELAALPERIREDFLQTVSILETVEGNISFIVPSYDDAYRIGQSMARVEENKQRREYRLESLRSCGGFYKRTDIEQLFDAQEGLCYYSMQPLTKNPKNYEIDHIIPVANGGSSWPGNLALAIKQVNQDKGTLTKDTLVSRLGKQYGKEWLRERREYCKRVNARRKTIDEARKRPVFAAIAAIDAELKTEFSGDHVSYSIHEMNGSIILMANDARIEFPPGFIRNPRLALSLEYIRGIAGAVLAHDRQLGRREAWGSSLESTFRASRPGR